MPTISNVPCFVDCLKVMAILLEENAMDYVHNNVGHKQSNIVVSEAFTELGPISILKGISVCNVC